MEKWPKKIVHFIQLFAIFFINLFTQTGLQYH